MSRQDLSVDDFMILVQPELEHQVDTMIAAQPIAAGKADEAEKSAAIQ